MAIQKRKEIEIKIRLGDDFTSLEEYRQTVKRLGFKWHENRLETDYLPDTANDLCKRNGLLLRFRRVQTAYATTWLLTLKQRASTEGVMDFVEIETDFKNVDTDTFLHIRQLVHKATGLTLDNSILQAETIDEVRAILQASGFIKDRILLDKFREEYSKAGDNITLDFFPDGMGAYMEVESHSKHELDSIVADLSIAPSAIITTDYGDLLKEHKKYQPTDKQRVATFTQQERDHLLGL